MTMAKQVDAKETKPQNKQGMEEPENVLFKWVRSFLWNLYGNNAR